MKICPRHPKHKEWLAKQGSQNAPGNSTKTSPAKPQQQQHEQQEGNDDELVRDLEEVVVTLGDLATDEDSDQSEDEDWDQELDKRLGDKDQDDLLSDEVDPDLQLDQYRDRWVTTESGFRYLVEGRPFSELPPEKEKKVRALWEAEQEAIEAVEEERGPVSKWTSLPQPREETEWDRYENKRVKAEKTYGTVESVYFMYKYRRNVWRETLKDHSGQHPDLSDTAYRKANKLPKYSVKDFRKWESTMSIEHMPRFCETRQRPFNIWTMEEKVAWIDDLGDQEKWVTQASEAIAEYWETEWDIRTPGESDIRRARLARSKGQQLTQLQKEILEQNIDKQREDWEQSKILGLAAAHSAVEAAGTADPFGLDWKDEDELQRKAKKDTAKALHEWEEREFARTGKKRQEPEPSPEKPGQRSSRGWTAKRYKLQA